MPVLGGMHRHAVLELLLVLPDGSKSLMPAAWTDMKPGDVTELRRLAADGNCDASDILAELAEE
ncbi:hypothetical protein ACQPXH_20620 [Nocardia sp. CA-135953]|uniref:hypothetical protein n=1 Tax=Nocardia sp. CA-135953 TaxID=3239978 RepID=UPI003D98D5D7